MMSPRPIPTFMKLWRAAFSTKSPDVTAYQPGATSSSATTSRPTSHAAASPIGWPGASLHRSRLMAVALATTARMSEIGKMSASALPAKVALPRVE
jgi:hypothetical protein